MSFFIADLEVDDQTRTVKRNGETVDLSLKEYQLLEHLARRTGTVLSRKELEMLIWKFESEEETNIIDVYISHLRNKIDKGHDEKLIHTVRGKGYVLK